ncbi:LuxE/PaaK family acyltransferase [Foetidibacter luteolus]|uniref:LuxE/PaaK family acyltransferase n=1 Tax=Foetidibacter luteolus TaxID=2608880 RepID=UPI001F16545E|nr:acyl transferase [Foetidibacter luteolus]
MSNLYKTNHQSQPPVFDVNNIFQDSFNFNNAAFQLFNYQFNNNKVYRDWCNAIGNTPDNVNSLPEIAFLPISFFKTHNITTGSFEPSVVFTSSGTTQSSTSRHLVKDTALYEKSFVTAFERVYGSTSNYCIIGLLPAYLERAGSSLVYMVNKMIGLSGHSSSGFYLNQLEELAGLLQQLEAQGQPTLLIGVTFALLDFAESHKLQLNHTIIMETGGMKGRRREQTRQEVHEILGNSFGVSTIHSEYGMTELLSQAYSRGAGRFVCPPWMKVLVRDEEDPLTVKNTGTGILNIIDLANADSCAFIATDDVGIVHEDGSFEVWGRMDNSDIRGCSLLVV